MADILDAFATSEYHSDWEAAKADHGDDSTPQHLARTGAQRRADALLRIARLAAQTAPGIRIGDAVGSIVIDYETFTEEVARLAGEPGTRRDPDSFHRRRCETATGRAINPTDATRELLLGRVRRVVVGSDSTVIDVGRLSRFFTGAGRLAALLNHPHCTHPGCETPLPDCDADHTIAWADRGSTSPNNGQPRCRFHNNLKNHGFDTTRNPDGTWTTTRPDGTIIQQ